MGFIMEIAAPFPSLWIWVTVTTLGVMALIVAGLPEIRSWLGPRHVRRAQRDLAKAKAKAKGEADRSLLEALSWVHRNPYLGEPNDVDYKTGAIAGDLVIPLTYKDRVLSAAVRMGDRRWAKHRKLTRTLLRRIAKWAGYTVNTKA